jgi:hypothetical protein
VYTLNRLELGKNVQNVFSKPNFFVDFARQALTGEKSSDQKNAYSSIVANMPPKPKLY